MDDVLKNMGEGKTRLEKITGIEEPIEETTSSVDFEYVKDQLNKIYKSVEDTKAKFPGFPIYISVSKDFNTWLTQYLNGEDYGIRLEQLFGCRYSVSPFIDTDDEWIVGLFDYASILGQWNTFQDKQYKISHLLTFITNNNIDDGKDGSNGES